MSTLGCPACDGRISARVPNDAGLRWDDAQDSDYSSATPVACGTEYPFPCECCLDGRSAATVREDLLPDQAHERRIDPAQSRVVRPRSHCKQNQGPMPTAEHFSAVPDSKRRWHVIVCIGIQVHRHRPVWFTSQASARRQRCHAHEIRLVAVHLRWFPNRSRECIEH